jgi:hypothetical protein
VKRLLLPSLLLALAAVPPAFGSQVLDRNASSVRLAVDRAGHALVTYEAGGHVKHVLVWGAVNARAPGPEVPQVRFRRDYSGGFGAFGRPLWRTFRNACGPYDGPALSWLVAACEAPDGSYWALQAWQKNLPHRGVDPWLAAQSEWELHISHWTGPPAKLEVWTDWAYADRVHDLFGQFTYLGVPVHGFATGRVPRDSYGRNLYIDTLDSRYGAGWKRETSVVSRRPNGNFCYSFWPTRDVTLPGSPLRPAGDGKRYRITAMGPGVTPDVSWEGADPGDFDPGDVADVAREREANAIVDRVAAGDSLCLQH